MSAEESQPDKGSFVLVGLAGCVHLQMAFRYIST